MAVLLFVWFVWLKPARDSAHASQPPAYSVEETSAGTCKIQKFDDELGPKWRCYQDGLKVPCPHALAKIPNCNESEDVLR